MTLPTKGNLPLQKRAGYNQGPQALSLSQIKFLGQPAIKCGAGDTVIFRNSPQVPGESNPRAIGMVPTIGGKLFNFTGGAVGYRLILFDALGNEFDLTGLESLDDKLYTDLNILYLTDDNGVFCLPVGWSLAVRHVSGNVAGGRFVAWPWSHDLSRNLVSIVEPVTTSGLEIGPPEGRAWQLTGNIQGAVNAGQDAARYLNFDSIVRHVDEEIVILAGEEFITNISLGVPVPVTIDPGEYGDAWLLLTDAKAKGMILAYPDKIRMVARENPTTAPLYVNLNFAEFDLPRDMG